LNAESKSSVAERYYADLRRIINRMLTADEFAAFSAESPL